MTTHSDIINDIVADAIQAAYDYAKQRGVAHSEVYSLLCDIACEKWDDNFHGIVEIDDNAEQIIGAVKP